MSDPFQKTHYRAFMLRFWDEQGRPDLPGEWRFSLEDPRSGKRLGFSNLDALIEYLQQEVLSLDERLHPLEAGDGPSLAAKDRN